jgi:hypothetical protein
VQFGRRSAKRASSSESSRASDKKSPSALTRRPGAPRRPHLDLQLETPAGAICFDVGQFRLTLLKADSESTRRWPSESRRDNLGCSVRGGALSDSDWPVSMVQTSQRYGMSGADLTQTMADFTQTMPDLTQTVHGGPYTNHARPPSRGLTGSYRPDASDEIAPFRTDSEAIALMTRTPGT